MCLGGPPSTSARIYGCTRLASPLSAVALLADPPSPRSDCCWPLLGPCHCCHCYLATLWQIWLHRAHVTSMSACSDISNIKCVRAQAPCFPTETPLSRIGRGPRTTISSSSIAGHSVYSLGVLTSDTGWVTQNSTAYTPQSCMRLSQQLTVL